MPVEIKELLIRVSVGETQAASAGTRGKPNTQNGSNPGQSSDQLLKACLEQTVELLQQKKER